LARLHHEAGSDRPYQRDRYFRHFADHKGAMVPLESDAKRGSSAAIGKLGDPDQIIAGEAAWMTMSFCRACPSSRQADIDETSSTPDRHVIVAEDPPIGGNRTWTRCSTVSTRGSGSA
jgi:hypothetical protein